MIINGFAGAGSDPAMTNASARIKRDLAGNIIYTIDTYSHTATEVYNQLNTSNSIFLSTLTVNAGTTISCTQGHSTSNYNSIIMTKTLSVPFEVQYIPSILVFKTTTGNVIPSSYITKTSGDGGLNNISVIVFEGYQSQKWEFYRYQVTKNPSQGVNDIAGSAYGYIGNARTEASDRTYSTFWMAAPNMVLGMVVTSYGKTFYGTVNTAFSVDVYLAPVALW